MLAQYKNIDDILVSTAPINGKRIDIRKNSIQQFIDEQVIYLNDVELPTTCELHVYSGKSWITGNHSVKLDLITDLSLPVSLYNPIKIPILQTIRDTKLVAGTYRTCVNFFTNILGSYNDQYLSIQEISPDRTEVKFNILVNSVTRDKVLIAITNFISNVSKTQTAKFVNKTTNYYSSYLLNFSRNQCVSFINSVVVGEFLYVKLLDPLPDIFDVDYKCWIVKEQLQPYIDQISIESKPVKRSISKLKDADFSVVVETKPDINPTFKSWSDLIGADKQPSNIILNTIFSGSLGGIPLNVDFSDFNNFIFYSSAKERVYNFRSKIQQIENYTEQSASFALNSSFTSKTTATDFEFKRNEIISKFDAFEEYLYYESSSKLTTYDVPLINPTVVNLTGSYIQPVPKSSVSFPYNLYSVSSSAFNTWYTDLQEKSSIYDSYNFNALQYAIPEYIKFNETNANLASYVNMIGHHFDLIYLHINQQSKIHSREENPNLGIPNKLLPAIAKHFGWILSDNTTSTELTDYYQSTSNNNSVLPNNKSSESLRTYTIWRRIVNNLPYLLKTRGTNRGIRALAACYGIDQSKLIVREYSNNISDINDVADNRQSQPRIVNNSPQIPASNNNTISIINVSKPGLVLPTGGTGLININATEQVNTVQIRFKPQSVITNPSIPTTMNIIKIGANVIDIQYSSGTNGIFLINDVNASNEIEMFNDNWISLNISTDGTYVNLLAKESFNGNIISAASASALSTFGATPEIILGDVGSDRFLGSIQELRLWSSVIDETIFNNHVTAPSSYNGNSDSYDELIFRLPFDQIVDHAATSSLLGDQPSQNAISASFTSWSEISPYDIFDETYYFDTPTIGPSTINNLNVRAIDIFNENNILDPNFSTEVATGTNIKSSGKLDIYFSPQNDINNDMISYFGNVSLDDYIGDPSDYTKNEYPELTKISRRYWKKFSDRFDLNKWIKIYTLYDVSFFNNVQQTLPINTAGNVGIVIQPTLLERSKDYVLPNVKYFNDTYEALITDTTITLESTYDYYTASISDVSPSVNSLNIGQNEVSILVKRNISSLYTEQLNFNLTASADKRYNGTSYSYDYVYWAGTTYVTGSTPYWMSEALLPILNTATLSEYRYNSSSLARTQDLISAGSNNHRYAGCKMMSPDFNINSTQTIDGGPVVEFNENTGNQLFYQSAKNDGSFYIS